MSKRRKSKRARPAKTRPQTFRITVEAQPVVVRYKPYAFGELGHFEFRSPHRPLRRIPMSETGYLSHYAPMREVRAAKSLADFARDEALLHLPWCRPTKHQDSPTLPLF
jgi:hypothetical protein